MAVAVPDRRGLYASVPVKFTVALCLAIAWAALSIVLSLGWLADLSAIVGRPAALIIIAFIAYVPGFMNAFMATTILLDRRPPHSPPAFYPAVSVLVACYNEALSISDTLTSLAAQDYPGLLEVIVLNDGSTDDSMLVAARVIGQLGPGGRTRLKLVNFPVNAGKAAVLNRGLALASHDLIVTVDGDCWLRPDSLTRIVERMLSDPEGTEAVAGAVLVRNSRRNLLTRAQEWDYFHGIAAVKRMQSMYHGTLVAQGAFSLYSRRALESVGGWPPCVGEDIVITWALLRAGYRVGYAEDALVFTNVPHEFRQFANQRRRWSRGLMEAFSAHWPLLFQPRLSTLFIWWNLLFLPLDLVYTFAFIPGLVLALFGIYWIAGPLTLAVLPLAVIWNWVIFRVQRRMLEEQGLRVRRNRRGFILYVFAYSLLMQPVCVAGYFAQFAGLRKVWGTK
ncbi:MAG: glycosyltransferase [Alphaproteobacteria bacterium]|nr:glycosyltransferase [Alphaproteobacteria bacterium]MBU2041689.1 glycosyltransferase [Alphaproteobacteria bacterium]MBU2125290.1 glycosyltransferase [Alphaproteobacteria bacterium]MBU2208739.1 glycosyltransferase [Alphaproteobacteria bacterium]MBU2290291.1 glycosyltransferase [Alphaproteobacteria bacterium]